MTSHLDPAPTTRPPIRSRLLAAFAAITMIATLLTVGSSTPAEAASASALGWAYASQPVTASYTPSGYNSEGKDNRVERVRRGQYKVTFPGLNRDDYEAQVVAQGDGSDFCGLDGTQNWRGSGRRGDDLVVYVLCHEGDNLDQADSRFVVSVTAQDGQSTHGAGVVWNDSRSQTQGYTAGPGHSIQRISEGIYDIRFFGQSSEHADVQVTAVSGPFGNWCMLDDLRDRGNDAVARISCWSVVWEQDTSFSLRFTTPQRGNIAFGIPQTTRAFQWIGPTGEVNNRFYPPYGADQTLEFPGLNGTPAGLMATPRRIDEPRRCALKTWTVNPVKLTVVCTDPQTNLPGWSSMSVWARTPPRIVFPTIPTTPWTPKFPGSDPIKRL